MTKRVWVPTPRPDKTPELAALWQAIDAYVRLSGGQPMDREQSRCANAVEWAVVDVCKVYAAPKQKMIDDAREIVRKLVRQYRKGLPLNDLWKYEIRSAFKMLGGIITDETTDHD